MKIDYYNVNNHYIQIVYLLDRMKIKILIRNFILNHFIKLIN